MAQASHERAWTITVFAAVTVWSILFLIGSDYQNLLPAAEEPLIAQHLARGDGFLSPMSPRPNAPPTSWSPPVYPVVMALATRVFGDGSSIHRGDSALTALMVFNALSFGAIAAGIYRLGSLLFSRAAGLISAGLLSVHPLFLEFVGGYWDSYLALAIFVWLMVAAQLMPQSAHPRLTSLGTGIALGFLSLTNASYALAYPLMVLYGMRGRPMRTRWFAAAISALAFVVVLLPWTLRNYSVFHEVYYVRGDLQLELWIGNQPVSTGWLDPVTLEEHPYRNPRERYMLLRTGEAAYFRQCGQRFVDEVASDPVGFLERCGCRMGYLFLSEPSRRGHLAFMPNIIWHKIVIDKVLLNATVTIIGLAGVWTAGRLSRRTVWPMAAALFASVPFALAAVSDRYTLPLRAILLLYGGFLIWAITVRLKRGAWPIPNARDL